MRSNYDVINELVDWGEENEQIKAMILWGSLENPNAFTDIFSDVDVLLIVKDARDFCKDDTWRKIFGKIIAQWGEEGLWDGNCLTRRYFRGVVYEDGSKIDFGICDTNSFLRMDETSFDMGYKVLIDKDFLTRNIKQPTYSLFTTKQPTEVEYLSQINEFCWNLTYAGKSLWRDELCFFKFIVESDTRFLSLQKMIEWYIGVKNDWKVNPNKFGRWFKRYLDLETWNELESTFSGVNIEDNWNALFNMVWLFKRLAICVGNNLGFTYPCELIEGIEKYLIKVKNLDKNAVNFE